MHQSIADYIMYIGSNDRLFFNEIYKCLPSVFIYKKEYFLDFQREMDN